MQAATQLTSTLPTTESIESLAETLGDLKKQAGIRTETASRTKLNATESIARQTLHMKREAIRDFLRTVTDVTERKCIAQLMAWFGSGRRLVLDTDTLGFEPLSISNPYKQPEDGDCIGSKENGLQRSNGRQLRELLGINSHSRNRFIQFQQVIDDTEESMKEICLEVLKAQSPSMLTDAQRVLAKTTFVRNEIRMLNFVEMVYPTLTESIATDFALFGLELNRVTAGMWTWRRAIVRLPDYEKYDGVREAWIRSKDELMAKTLMLPRVRGRARVGRLERDFDSGMEGF